MNDEKKINRKLLIHSILIAVIMVVSLVGGTLWVKSMAYSQNPVKKDKKLMQDTMQVDTLEIKVQHKVIKEQNRKLKVRLDSLLKKK